VPAIYDGRMSMLPTGELLSGFFDVMELAHYVGRFLKDEKEPSNADHAKFPFWNS